MVKKAETPASTPSTPKPIDPSAIQIVKVRNKRVSINIEYKQNGDDFDINLHDKPLESFYEALAGLNRHVGTLCEFPAKYAESIEATGITLSEKGENVKALIVSQKRIHKGKRVLNIPTPLLTMYADPENKTADHMDKEIADAIELLIREAKRYIVGERGEGKIEHKPTPEEENEKDPNQEKFPDMTRPPA